MAPQRTKQHYMAVLPIRFVVICTISCVMVAFAVGRVTRYLLHIPELQAAHKPAGSERVALQAPSFPPTPKIPPGKVMPHTIYTSKNFDTSRSASVSQWLVPSGETSRVRDANNVSYDLEPQNEKLSLENGELHYKKEEQEHIPAGQHLLVDIDNVDASFLNSDVELESAMVRLVDNSRLTLLSYHCHGLYPDGVSCVGVLLESHIALHTWPSHGVIALDLFTCGSASLLDSMPLIEELFAIPRKGRNSQPTVHWAYKRRGFKDQSALVGLRDTFAYPLGIHGMEMKKEVASTKTSTGKRVRVYDVEPLGLHFYVDGILKDTFVGQAAAYESFVHPPMLAHESPKRVLALGAGLGQSIQEVLKYNGMDQATVVGADKDLMNFACENFLALNTESRCFDDPRVKIVEDQRPLDWVSNYDGEAFDVVLVDLLEMEEEYANEIIANLRVFLDKLYSILSRNGVASVNVFGSARVVDSRARKGGTQYLKGVQSIFAEVMKSVGFEQSFAYEENDVSLPETRLYAVGFKDRNAAMRWERNDAQINIELRNRLIGTASDHLPLVVFDGPIMATYSKTEPNTKTTMETARAGVPNGSLRDIKQNPSVCEATSADEAKKELNSSFSRIRSSRSCNASTMSEIEFTPESSRATHFLASRKG
eukprot:CAMPEP_0178865454 /NCGR_PEP_ID=MMETSP0747-20121128/4430_1 /TAXON_ID=913974 /ORGANISM="Nitzschia punctata, Strain CCMP561" /LENGTH=651 /DNA_ID=CAMNT_0020532265 /DNA_START=14 /DNA_END=1969 /DNA_ORIENTATION=+